MSQPISSNGNLSSNGRVTPKCGHNVSMKLFVSKSVANPGRKFWKCKFWGKGDDCNIFLWDDEFSGERDFGHSDVGSVELMRKIERDIAIKMEAMEKKIDGLTKKMNYVLVALICLWVHFFLSSCNK
ncbi:uncharacterized protein LOC131657759 [Vicia villosa]|uniref:uncharacterized protein LOC131657759 n=1 Tax=Vicia villosa TaxID=3911 RepID=UPI00273B59CB|nr:uncharacterized protein LOC131657759 [Vicia villosa]